MATQEEERPAERDWHTTAIIRIIQETKRQSVSPWRERIYHVGEEFEMHQWGYKDRPVWRNNWWSSYDVDAAFIIEAEKVEVVRVIDETAPFDQEDSTLTP